MFKSNTNGNNLLHEEQKEAKKTREETCSAKEQREATSTNMKNKGFSNLNKEKIFCYYFI